MTEANDGLADHARLDIRVELQGCRSKAELLARIATAMHFPSWFGHNWDALADCLCDLSWLPASGYVIHFKHAHALRCAAPEVLDTLLEILAEAAAFWADEGVDFQVRVADADAGPDAAPPCPTP